MAQLKSYSVTDKGLSRDNNEDCFLSKPDSGLWAIADGMGGHEAGEVASGIVKDKLALHHHDLKSGILQSHQAVLDAINSGHGPEGMGSTVVSLKSTDDHYQIAWVGDSRAYLWTKQGASGKLQQLTTDHSYVQVLLDSGAINEDEMSQHPDKNVITQCIGANQDQPIEVESIERYWHTKEWVILCSDGLTNEVDDEQISEVLSSCSAPQEACQQLLKKALDHGGSDNITIQIIESPSFKLSPLMQMSHALPPVLGNRFIDNSIYTLALLSSLLILYWSMG